MSAKIHVFDYATGAKGSFCIGRPCADNSFFREFWNPTGWAGSGFVFENKKLAYAVRDLLAYKQEHV
jgi:hypothetical protein